MKTIKIFQIITILLCAILFLLSAEVIAEAGHKKETLVIGRISDNPEKHHNGLNLLVNYVTSHMLDLGITKSSVLIAKDLPELISYLKEGKVDWVSDTPYAALLLAEETGAEIILRRWKKGVPNYYTVFFTRNDNAIDSLLDLKGKKIAFEDPSSTSAYFLPLSFLKSKGLDMVKLSSPRENIDKEKVGYAFAGGELNITTWVYKGLTDAGAFNNKDWEDPTCTPEAFKANLKIIDKTTLFPRSVELIRYGIHPKIKNRIKEILLNADKDPNAEEALRAYSRTKKFDEFKDDVKNELIEAQKLLKFVRKELK